jgi:micrococcal nuclease
MKYWLRGGAIAAGGFLVGLVIGFVGWGRAPAPGGLSRVYPDGARVRVGRVVDGDTVVLEDGVHLRYRGCDTPETFRFTRDPEPHAEAATTRNREMVEGAWVRLRFPPRGLPAIDAHGRVLADVRLDAENWPDRPTVAETLVSEGFAKLSSFELEGAALERMRRAQEGARESGRGIWARQTPPPTTRFVASRRGRMVHRPDCTYAEKIAPTNRMFYDTLEAALREKRRRCPTCFADGAAPRAPTSTAKRESTTSQRGRRSPPSGRRTPAAP